jgi:hypothetical protein
MKSKNLKDGLIQPRNLKARSEKDPDIKLALRRGNTVEMIEDS